MAVDAFLNKQIKYLSIPQIVEKTLNKASISDINSIKDVIEIDEDSRGIAKDLISSGKF